MPISILRFENLSGETSLDWAGRGLAEVLGGELTGPAGTRVISSTQISAASRAMGPRPVTAPGVSAERAAATVSGANRMLYGYYSGQPGKLRVHAVLEDLGSGRMERSATVSGDIFTAARQLARDFGGEPKRFGTGSEAALRAYVAGIEAADTDQAAAAFERAAAADPNFGAAYLRWAQAAAAKSRDAARQILETARSRDGLLPLDRARVDVALAAVAGDQQRRTEALAEVARLDPNDPTLFRSLGEAAMSARRYSEAIRHLGRAVALDPNDVASYNLLGYAQAYTSNLPAAVEALRQYEKLAPGDPNSLDSLGDVHYYAGRFADAERFYLEAYQRNPAFQGGVDLIKAAYARVMTGDVSGADGLFGRYRDERRKANDPLLVFREGEWLYGTGRRSQAAAALAAAAQTAPPQVGWRLHAQLAFWKLNEGDRTAAQREAQHCAGVKDVLARMVIFLTGPEVSAAQWAERAERGFPEPQLRTAALAYGLLMAQDYQAALEPLKDLYAQSNALSNEDAPILLAWAYIETGRFSEAAPLLRGDPPPQVAAPRLLANLAFPRILELRARVLEKQNRANEARRNLELFRKLSAAG